MDNRGFNRRTWIKLGHSVVSFPHVAFMTVYKKVYHKESPFVSVVLENGVTVEASSHLDDYQKALTECKALVSAWEEYLDI